MLIPTLLIHHWGKPVATPARTTTPVPNVVVPKTEPKLKASGPPRKQVGTASMPKASAVGPIPTSSAKSTPVKSPEMKRLRKVEVDTTDTDGPIKNLSNDFDGAMEVEPSATPNSETNPVP